MARVELVIPDEDRERFDNQARREGMSLSAWLLVAARDRTGGRLAALGVIASPEDLWALFHGCDEMDWMEAKPDLSPR